MESKPLPRLNVERVFDKVVDLAQGIRIDTMVGASPSFDNADYYFEGDRIWTDEYELITDQNECKRLEVMAKRLKHTK